MTVMLFTIRPQGLSQAVCCVRVSVSVVHVLSARLSVRTRAYALSRASKHRTSARVATSEHTHDRDS
eukprot:scaffold10321_cov122-Isochrysis_galbana.AAC.4